MPEMEYVIQTGSNLKEIHLEVDDKHVFTPQLCVHSCSDTRHFSMEQKYMYMYLYVYVHVHVYVYVFVCTFYRQKLLRDYFIHY